MIRQNANDIQGSDEPPSSVFAGKSRDLWQTVQDNHRRLASCRGPHQFVPLWLVPRPPNGRQEPALPDHRCTECGGIVGFLQVRWYERGLAHARDAV
jgi:hypothetical protein